ncbi:hypothetical protein B0T11DRAFT_24006 [Plectosphaerella cucumerina]|uniref:Uncharacterized protein n=1 Tax=Plectosphaerella cucumerina TaxID=40658 RepID=A0A8K0X9E1_9PEZI|nr:hypothetical protein B0T11DRAFT_24006 [Plectosphaerella cucumerina]
MFATLCGRSSQRSQKAESFDAGQADDRVWVDARAFTGSSHLFHDSATVSNRLVTTRSDTDTVALRSVPHPHAGRQRGHLPAHYGEQFGVLPRDGPLETSFTVGAPRAGAGKGCCRDSLIPLRGSDQPLPRPCKTNQNLPSRPVSQTLLRSDKKKKTLSNEHPLVSLAHVEEAASTLVRQTRHPKNRDRGSASLMSLSLFWLRLEISRTWLVLRVIRA